MFLLAQVAAMAIYYRKHDQIHLTYYSTMHQPIFAWHRCVLKRERLSIRRKVNFEQKYSTIYHSVTYSWYFMATFLKLKYCAAYLVSSLAVAKISRASAFINLSKLETNVHKLCDWFVLPTRKRCQILDLKSRNVLATGEWG